MRDPLETPSPQGRGRGGRELRSCVFNCLLLRDVSFYAAASIHAGACCHPPECQCGHLRLLREELTTEWQRCDADHPAALSPVVVEKLVNAWGLSMNGYR